MMKKNTATRVNKNIGIANITQLSSFEYILTPYKSSLWISSCEIKLHDLENERVLNVKFAIPEPDCTQQAQSKVTITDYIVYTGKHPTTAYACV